MKVDVGGYAPSVDEAARAALRAESLGYDGWYALETKHDPFLGSAIAAERTERVQVGTKALAAVPDRRECGHIALRGKCGTARQALRQHLHLGGRGRSCNGGRRAGDGQG